MLSLLEWSTVKTGADEELPKTDTENPTGASHCDDLRLGRPLSFLLF